ncbi:MAG: MBL fold metallo-hydrolase [Nitrospinae bacterium]|nr:MBL fold metallo-hydrolase [Nitrospinota bacterium]
MELTLLGTGACAPDPERSPSCYMLTIGAARFLIDPGPGAVNRILAAGMDPFGVEAIVITHHHLDHCADLLPYLFAYKNCLESAPKNNVTIFAPAGFKNVFAKLMEVYGRWIYSADYEIRIEEMGSGEYHAAGYSIRSLPMLHGANGLGYRFERAGGPTLAYSGDTAYCSQLIELSRGADLLLLECTYPDGVETDGHMRTSEAARAGILSGAKRLVLTHFHPSQDTSTLAEKVRSAGYAREVIVGEDGMKIRI